MCYEFHQFNPPINSMLPMMAAIVFHEMSALIQAGLLQLFCQHFEIKWFISSLNIVSPSS